jgi:Ala-tRNA(Pro) deacylase
MTDVYQFLVDNQVEYERHDHPPVYTVADVERLVPPLPAAKTKNLFLRDKKGKRHFLVVVPAQKRVDIKALGAVIGAGRLSFGSAERLKRYLGVDPGSVTILAIIRDPDHAVEVFFDEILWAGGGLSVPSPCQHQHPGNFERQSVAVLGCRRI